nr:MAG TPA: hypothetical protein [Caudoviricetes sp.]
MRARVPGWVSGRTHSDEVAGPSPHPEKVLGVGLKTPVLTRL